MANYGRHTPLHQLRAIPACASPLSTGSPSLSNRSRRPRNRPQHPSLIRRRQNLHLIVREQPYFLSAVLYTTLPPTIVNTDTVFGNSGAGTVNMSCDSTAI